MWTDDKLVRVAPGPPRAGTGSDGITSRSHATATESRQYGPRVGERASAGDRASPDSTLVGDRVGCPARSVNFEATRSGGAASGSSAWPGPARKAVCGPASVASALSQPGHGPQPRGSRGIGVEPLGGHAIEGASGLGSAGRFRRAIVGRNGLQPGRCQLGVQVLGTAVQQDNGDEPRPLEAPQRERHVR